MVDTSGFRSSVELEEMELLSTWDCAYWDVHCELTKYKALDWRVVGKTNLQFEISIEVISPTA